MLRRCGSNIVCASDYHGYPTVTVCSGAGELPSYSGCKPDSCTQALPDGYAVLSLPTRQAFKLFMSVKRTNNTLKTIGKKRDFASTNARI